jgi:hypothetical protein
MLVNQNYMAILTCFIRSPSTDIKPFNLYTAMCNIPTLYIDSFSDYNPVFTWWKRLCPPNSAYAEPLNVNCAHG